MNKDTSQVVDELARAMFDVLERNDQLKQPAAIGVAQGLSGGPRRVARRSETVWQDYRQEARTVLRQSRN